MTALNERVGKTTVEDVIRAQFSESISEDQLGYLKGIAALVRSGNRDILNDRINAAVRHGLDKNRVIGFASTQTQ